jgi:hypothetical protein
VSNQDYYIAPDASHAVVKIGQVYRIPWKCDMLARVTAIPNGTFVKLDWVDQTWRHTELGLWYSVWDFLNCDPKPILMEDDNGTR